MGENQEFLEFIANSVTDPCVETMIVEVIKNAKFVKVIYDYEGSHANKNYQEEIMLVYLYQLRKATLLISVEE